MQSSAIFNNIRKCTQYNHLQTDTDIEARVDKQTIKILAKLETDECTEKDIYYSRYANKAK